jgi:hypothetical protein
MILALDTSMGQVRFEDPVNLSDTPIEGANPHIAAVGDQVFVYWSDHVPGRSDLRLAHSTDHGVTFRNWNLSPGIQYPYGATVAADEKNIYVGFPAIIRGMIDPPPTGLFLSRSNDRGESFYPPFDLSGRGAFGGIVMGIQDGILHVAWSELGIFFTKSTDFGESFSEPVRASSNPRAWGTSAVALALDGDQVYVEWASERPGLLFQEIYFARSKDGGKTFGAALNLSRSTQFLGLSRDPQLALGDKGYLYAAWAQGLGTDPRDPLPLPSLDIYFARSTDGGDTFDKRINLSNNPRATNTEPRMVAAGENIYIVWYDNNGVLLARSTDGGETFSTPQKVSVNPGSGSNAEIAVIEKRKLLDEGITDDVVYVIWGGGPRVFFSASLDSGATWSEPENISHTRGFPSGPRLAAVGKNVYVTWMDSEPGRWSPYFVRGYLELDSQSGPSERPDLTCQKKIREAGTASP